jgi:hypothetical protein
MTGRFPCTCVGSHRATLIASRRAASHGSAPLWDDDYVDPAKADLWLFFAKHVLQEARRKASEMDGGGGGGGGELGMLSGMVGGGAGGGKNFNTAEVHLQNGQTHYDKKEFAQAMECYKAASNWYCKCV